MHATSIIILAFSHAGYWLAGTDATVSIRWTVPNQTPQATLVWELSIDSIRLDHGSIPMSAGDRATDMAIKCPNVRTRTGLTFHYQLLSPDGKQELAVGGQTIQAFPDDMTAGWSRLLAGKSVIVLDAPEGLPGLLTGAHVEFTRIDEASDLRWGHPDMILVGADRLDDSPFSQGFLIEQARAGAGVVIFQQSRVSRLNGFSVVLRARPAQLQWMTDHPLLAHLSAADLSSWLIDLPRDVPAVRLPSNASAATLAGWQGDLQFRSTDALFTLQSTVRGRIVLCQLPLGSWKTDPRTIVLLGNLLDYLSTPSEPMEPVGSLQISARRSRTSPILIPAGDDR